VDRLFWRNLEAFGEGRERLDVDERVDRRVLPRELEFFAQESKTVEEARGVGLHGFTDEFLRNNECEKSISKVLFSERGCSGDAHAILHLWQAR
jgi:hypothetical protein